MLFEKETLEYSITAQIHAIVHPSSSSSACREEDLLQYHGAEQDEYGADRSV